MRKILLTKGVEAIVDDEDYAKLVELGRWHICSGYASRYTAGGIKTRKRYFMHHTVLGVTPDLIKVVDHINRNKLDNRKNNLRVVSRRLNGTNTKVSARNKSGYKGVTFYPRHKNPAKQWRASYASRTIGYFASAEDASDAYETYISMIK